MALYRFLFAPVLLAVAVLTTSPHRAPQPQRAPAPAPASAAATVSAPSPSAGSPTRDRVRPSRPGSVR